MVNRLTRSLVLILVMLATWPAMADDGLKVTPDRTRLYEGETLTLTVEGSMKIEINLENLFDLGNANLPSPDIEKLEGDFEVVGQNQRYSIRTVNNEMRGQITWTYQLLPKNTGKLTIPALTFKDSTSEPVTIEVVEGSPPSNDGEIKDTFIELSTDKDELYVQEQLVFTVKLFFSGNLIRGDLSAPEHPDAIIESLGKQKEYTETRNGNRYRVVERQYAVYPQQPGELQLGAIRFEGQSRDSSGQLRFLRDSKRLFDIPVRDVPQAFSGDVWLPASNLSLSESGLEQLSDIETGQSLTRTLQLVAEGLPPSALPSLPTDVPSGIRIYPEQEQRKSSTSDQGIASTLTQVNALVPVTGGRQTLPEIRIPWWDTDSDSEKVAVLPARTLQVSGNGVIAEAPSGGSAATEADSQAETGTVTGGSSLWPWISALLAAGWIATLAVLVIWWRKRRNTSATGDHYTPERDDEQKLFQALCNAASEGHPETLNLLPRWMNLRFPDTTVLTATEAARQAGDKVLEKQVKALQQRLYADTAQGSQGAWEGREMVKSLKQLRGKKPAGTGRGSNLPPLYPDALSP